jgi:hypothetical protein
MTIRAREALDLPKEKRNHALKGTTKCKPYTLLETGYIGETGS